MKILNQANIESLFPSAEAAREMADKANSQKIHPLCFKELTEIYKQLEEAYKNGLDSIDVLSRLREDTIDFLKNKGYDVITYMNNSLMSQHTTYTIHY